MQWIGSSTRIVAALVGIGLCIGHAAAAQDIFKCVDASAQVAFQATHCSAGQSEQVVDIAPAPKPAPSPDYARAPDQAPLRHASSRGPASAPAEQSFECRTASGALFYRHGGCPATIGREDPKANLHASRGERVRARRIPRAEACRGLRSVGRSGREYDDLPSTYDRNLGRDPCRRY